MMRLFVSAGDLSGDTYAAGVIAAVRGRCHGLRVHALGGPALKAAADVFARDVVSLSVSGFLRPFARLATFNRILSDCRALFAHGAVDAVLLVDYYGFNIHLAAAAHRAGLPVVYFISPQVWATRRYRIRRIKQYVSRMLVAFPFEQELYEQAGVPVEYVGHPLGAVLPGRRVLLADRLRDPRIGLLPGSRRAELVRHLPLLARTVLLLRQRLSRHRLFLFVSTGVTDADLRSCGFDPSLPVEIVREADCAVRSTMSLALTCSGTATLENTFLGVPMVCFYRMHPLNYLIARALITIDMIAMPNILARRRIVPELIQGACTPAALAARTVALAADNALLEETHRQLLEAVEPLRTPDCYQAAAAALCKEVGCAVK